MTTTSEETPLPRPRRRRGTTAMVVTPEAVQDVRPASASQTAVTAPAEEPSDDTAEDTGDSLEVEDLPRRGRDVDATATEPDLPTRPPVAVFQAGRASNGLAAVSEELKSRKIAQFLATEDDLSSVTEGLEFGEAQHEVKLTRVRSNPPGVSKGFLDTFQRRVGLMEIKDLYGGGEFLYTIWGPDASGKKVLKAKKTLLIEGPSLVNGVPIGAGNVITERPQDKELFKLILTDKQREADRLAEELKELKKQQQDLLQKDNLSPLLTAFKETEEKRLLALKEAAERQEKLEAQRRADEKEARERQEKLEAQRRAEEKEAREMEKAKMKEETTTLLSLMQQNTNMLIASMKDAASSKEAGFATILASVQASANQQLQTLQANFGQQMEMFKAQMNMTVENMKAFSEQRESLLKDALKEAKSGEGKKDLTSQINDLVKLKTTLDVLIQPQGAPSSGIVDTLKEFASSPAASAVMQRFIGGGIPQQPPPGLPPGMSSPPVAMGSVQVSGPRPQLKGPSPWPTTTGAPPPPEKPKVRKPTVQTPPTAVPPAVGVNAGMPQQPATPKPPAPQVESLGVVFPAETDSNEQKFEALVRALDAAVRADWAIDHIHDLLIPKFPKDVMEKLKDTPFEQCTQIIELMAPSSVLNTAQGFQVLKELYSRLGVAQ